MGTRIQKDFGFLSIFNKELDESLSTFKLSDLASIATDSEKKWLAFDLRAKIDQNLAINNFYKIIDPEYSGLDKSLVIFKTPMYSSEWSRSGNPIDFYEQTNIDAIAKIQYLHDQITPYTEPKVISLTGQILNKDECELLRMFPLQYWNENLDAAKAGLELKGLDFNKELLPQTHMLSPIVIRLMARAIGITDENQVRAAIVTHWA